MATAKKIGPKRPAGKNGAVKKPPKKAKPSAFKWPGVWVTDPETGERFRLFLRRLPGKGKIPLKDIRAAVRKVRDERLARERAATPADTEPTE